MKRDTSDDKDISDEWIAVTEAATMLAGTDEDVRRLVRMRRIQWREAEDTVCMDDVVTVLELREFDAVRDGGGSEKEARRRAEAVRARWEADCVGGRVDGCRGEERTSKTGFPITAFGNDDALLASQAATMGRTPGIENCNLIEGRQVVSVVDAALMLEITKGQIWKICRDGRLNYEQVGRLKWIWVSDIEDYGRLQKIWEEKGGKWTAYGKRERKGLGGRVDGCLGERSSGGKE
jgi:hypothetical protein